MKPGPKPKRRDIECVECGAIGVAHLTKRLCATCNDHANYMKRRHEYLAGGKRYITAAERKRRRAAKLAREQEEQQQ